jgi:hypothetical protein
MKYIPSIAFEEMSGSAKGVTAAKMKSRKYIRNRGYGGSVRTADQAKVKGVFKRSPPCGRPHQRADPRLEQARPQPGGPQRPGHQGQDLGSNLFTRLNYWIVACGGQP